MTIAIIPPAPPRRSETERSVSKQLERGDDAFNDLRQTIEALLDDVDAWFAFAESETARANAAEAELAELRRSIGVPE